MFINEKGFFIVRYNTITPYHIGVRNDYILIKENKDSSNLGIGVTLANTEKKIKIYQIKNAVYLDSMVLKTFNLKQSGLLGPGLSDGKLYLFNEMMGKCYVVSNFTTHPLSFKIDSISIPEPFNNYEFNNTSFYLLGVSGKIYLFNKKTLQAEEVVTGNYLTNSIFKDSKNNLWVSTIDKGLLMYKKKQFGMVDMPDKFTHSNFLSIARKQDGTLVAGNFYGEVLEIKDKKINSHTIPEKTRIARQRKILLSQNKVFTFSESGIYINYTKKLSNAKTAIAYNDSIILFGKYSGLQKINTITEKIILLKPINKRVTAITKLNDSIIYFGSTDGVYKYYYGRDRDMSIAKNHPLLSQRVSALCTTQDGLLWVATSGGGVAVVKNDSVICHMSEKEGIIDNASRSITTGKTGQVWLGTTKGISVIVYTIKNNKVNFSIQNLSVNDGLTNNVVNEMLYHNDTVYAATGDGIAIIQANISISKFNIPVQLIRASINQRDTIIATHYKLGYNQRNILLQFAGIELNGHFKNLQYILNKNNTWISLADNTLILLLNNGHHILQIRAVDVNGNTSNRILTIEFTIATPFWKALWFWIVLAIAIQIAIIYFVNQRQKKRKSAKLAKEIATVQTAALEQQAFTSLMNPHFIFNALNSVQHYINVQDRQNANRYLSDFASLIRKNFEAAQQSFIPLEQELENLTIYLRLEQMRFTNRFTYTIEIDDQLDIDNWMIPTMMLQPLLENALLHGIMPSTINGQLVITLKEAAKNLVITITDNGIGMANSRVIKQNEPHKSHGMGLIIKRIDALSHLCIQPFTINMHLPFEDDKNPGNAIVLLIPAELYPAWLKAKQK
jgi:two-component sensor histidine kinase